MKKLILSLFLLNAKLMSIYNSGEQCTVTKGKHRNAQVTIISAFDQFDANTLGNRDAYEYLLTRLTKLPTSEKKALSAEIVHAQNSNKPVNDQLASYSVAGSYRVQLPDGTISYVHESELQRPHNMSKIALFCVCLKRMLHL